MTAHGHVVVDGRRIAYQHTEGSRRPLVFVHGWTCARWAFAPQLAYFGARGHELVALDLPGHGDSDPIGGPIGVDVLAAAVQGVMEATGTVGAVVIGHSLGGMTALALAAASPATVHAVVAVDPAPMCVAPADDGALVGVAAALRDEASRAGVFGAILGSFFHADTDPAVRAVIEEGMSSATDDARVEAFAAMTSIDGPATLAAVTVPVLHIAAAPPLNDPAAFAALVPDCTTGMTVGAGHFNQLEVPEQVNSMIERFLQAIASR